MDKTSIIARLKEGKPLFDSLPTPHRKLICGTESEYGVQTDYLGRPIIEEAELPMILNNGGEVYVDCKHVEYASPESSNAVSAVAFYEAGKRICWKARYSPQLFCNNNDCTGSTFGAHENYFTSTSFFVWGRLIPFLVARTVLSGAGWVTSHGKFEISQRASHIERPMSDQTTIARGIINLRQESLAKVPGWSRLHIICGDAGMSQMSTFLRIGTMNLVVEMLELGALPDVSYDNQKGPEDMRKISKETSGWVLDGIKRGPRSVVEVLAIYLERAKSVFSHRDLVTDVILAVWADTLESLARNPRELCRRLDWVIKLTLLEAFKDDNVDWTLGWLQSQDLEYHNLNPERGLYYQLHPQMEKLVSDQVIMDAMETPPVDTRANIRGKLARYLRNTNSNRSLCANGWEQLVVVAGKQLKWRGIPHPDDWWEDFGEAPAEPRYLDQAIPDPRLSYDKLFESLVERLG